MATAAQATKGQLWFRALRAPVLGASVIPVLLAGVFALVEARELEAGLGLHPWPSPTLFLLALVGAVCVHLATNMLNDNFDYRSGDDLAVKHQNPFAGGGRVLTQGVLNVNAHLAVALGFLGLGSLIGLCLVTTFGLLLLSAYRFI